jgi:hypothetical protein
MALVRAPKKGAGGSETPVEMCKLASGYPTLVEFLSVSKWPDGAERQRGTVLLLWEEGNYKCWLNDRDGDRTAWLTGATLTDLLAAVDTALEADSVPWRAAGFKPKGKR